uniref:Uncharacterized protein n=1 Tax=Anguilla anguilla TaxID=7936 RepID=A0A0E9T039_ANGAN
MFTTKENTYSW